MENSDYIIRFNRVSDKRHLSLNKLMRECFTNEKENPLKDINSQIIRTKTIIK